MHDWKRGSEAYSYFTEGNPAIMMLFYEHMAYMLAQKIPYIRVVEFLKNYPNIFPKPSKERNVYWNGVEQNLLATTQEEVISYKSFLNECSKIVKMKVNHVLSQLAFYLLEQRAMIEYEISNMNTDEVVKIAVEAKYRNLCADIERQQDNIIRFRPHD